MNPHLEPIDELDQDCYEHDLAYARGEDELDADWKFFKNSMSSSTNLKHKLYGTALGLKSLIGYKINQEVEQMAKKGKKINKKQLKKVEKKIENKVVRHVQQAPKHRLKYQKPKKQKGKLNNLFGMTKHVQAPINVGTYSKFRQSKNVVRPTAISGTFNLFTINNNNVQTVPGTKLYSALIDENFFNNARVGVFFHLFEQWGGHVEFEYVSSSATTASGNLIMAIDPDAGDPERNDDLSTALIQMVNPVAFPPWVSGAKTHYGVKKLWCNNTSSSVAENRQTAMCRLYVSNESTLPPSTNDYGFIRVHYRLKFWKSVSEPTLTSATAWAQWIMDDRSVNWPNTYTSWEAILNNATKFGNTGDYVFTAGAAATSFIIKCNSVGQYMLSGRLSVSGVTTAASSLTGTPSGSGLSVISLTSVGTSTSNGSPSDCQTIAVFCRFNVTTPGSSLLITNSGGAVVANLDFSYMTIQRIGESKPLTLEQQIEQAVSNALSKQNGKEEIEDVYLIKKQNNNNSKSLNSGTKTPPFVGNTSFRSNF